MRESSIRVAILGHSADYQGALLKATKATREFRQEQVKAALSSRALEHQTRDLNRQLRIQSIQLGALTLQWVQFRQVILTTALRTAITGMAATAAAAGSLAGAVGMLGQQFGLLATGGITTGIAMLAAFTQGSIVAKLALEDIGKVLTSSGKEYERAFSKLTKPAQEFVKEIRGLRDAWREIKLTTQAGLFPGLTRAVRNAKTLFEPLKQAAYDTATALGYLAERASIVAAGRKGDIAAMLQRNVVTMRRMGDSAINVARALTDVFRAADPFIGHVTRQLVTFTEQLADLAKYGRDSGKLGNFFKDVRESWDQWLRIIGNIGEALWNVLKAASGPAKDMADAIERATQRWADLSGNAAGQAKLKRFFEASNKVLGSMAKFAGALVLAMGELTISGSSSAAKFFDVLREKFLPVLVDIAKMLDKGVFTRLLDMFGTLMDIVRSALPGLEPFAAAIGWVAAKLNDLLKAMGGLIERMPSWSRFIGLLALGGTVLWGWGKLRLAIQLATYELRRFLGLVPDGPSAFGAAGRGMFLNRGGRPGEVGGMAGGGGTGGGGGGSSLFVAGGGGGRQFGQITPSTVWAPSRKYSDIGRSVLNRTYGNARDMASGSGIIGVGPVGSQLRRQGRFGPASPVIIGPMPMPTRWTRRNAKGEPFGHRGAVADEIGGPRSRDKFGRTQVTWAQMEGFDRRNPVMERPTGRAAAARSAMLVDKTVPLKSWEKPLAFFAGNAQAAGQALKDAKPAIGQAAKGAAKLGGAFAAFGGAMGFMGSSSDSMKGRLRDLFSGATMGAVQSSESVGNKNVAMFGRAAPQLLSGKGFNESGGFWNSTAGKLFSPIGSQVLGNNFVEDLKKLGADGGKATVAELRKAIMDNKGDLGAAGTEAALEMLRGYKRATKELQDAKYWGRFKEIMSQVRDGWKNLSGDTKATLSDLRQTTESQMNLIATTLGTRSSRGRKALEKNYNLAAEAVRRLMNRGVVSTETGLKEIERLMRAKLRALGWSGAQAAALRDNGTLQNQSDRTPGAATDPSIRQPGAARGMLKTLPGRKGGDSMPLNIMAAPGEDVAILNRHQRKVVDQRLADMGGLPGLFRNVRTPHNRPGFAGGGMVTGDTDVRPSLLAKLRRLAAAAGTPIYIQDGGRTMAEQAALYAKYKSGRGNLAAAPTPNAPHIRGIAADITPGQGVFGKLAARFGLGFPVPGEPWHIQMMDAAGLGVFGGSGAGGMTEPKLKRWRTELKGMIGGVAQGTVDKYREAAQQTIHQAFVEATAGQGDGADPTAGASGKIPKGWTRTGATTFGGPGDPGTGHIGYRGDDLNKKWGSFAELNMGTALGGLPYGARIKVRKPGGGKTLTLSKRDIGAGGGAIGGYPRTIDLWHMAAQRLGLPGVWSGPIDYKRAVLGLLATPPRNDGTPNVNSKDVSGNDITKKKSSSKSKTKKKPTAPHLPTPGQRAATRAKQKRKAPVPLRARKLNAWLGGLDDQAWIEDFLDGFGIGSDRAEELSGEFLRQDTIYNSREAAYRGWLGGFADEELIPDDQKDAKLRDLIALITGTPQGNIEALPESWLSTFQYPLNQAGGLTQNLLEQMRMSSLRITRSQSMRSIILREMSYLRDVWQSKTKLRNNLNSRMSKMVKNKPSKNDIIRSNEDTIEDIEDYLRAQQKRATTMKLSAEDRKDMTDERARMKRLRKQNADLKKSKSKGTALPLEQRRAYNELKAGRDNANDWLSYIAGTADPNLKSLEFAGGLYGSLKGRVGILDSTAASSKDDYTSAWSNYGSQYWSAKDMLAEIAKQPSVPKPDDSYLRSQLQEANRTVAVSQAWADVFRGFAPLLGMRNVGAFLHGGVVPETGMALVHKDETIVPDPQGPFGSTAGGNVNVGGAQVQLVVGGELAPLVKLIDARIDGKAPQIVNRELGRSRRISQISPGR